MPSTQKQRNWVIVVGAIVGILTLLFYMGLVFASLLGYSVPCDSRALLSTVMAFGVALSLAFLGGNAAISGALGTWVKDHPLTFSASGGVAVFLIILIIGGRVYSCEGETDNLKITRIQILDETKSTIQGQGTVLTALAQRPTTEYRISKTSDLSIAFLFVVEGYRAKPNLTVSLRGWIELKGGNGGVLARAPTHILTNVKDWRLRPPVKNIGASRVVQYLSIPEQDSIRSPIPYVVILDHFRNEEIPQGDGRVSIEIHDDLGTSKIATASFDIRVVK